MFRYRRTSLLLIIVACCAGVYPLAPLPSTAAASRAAQSQSLQPVVVNAVDSGWYTQTGFHDPLNTSYSVGWSGRSIYRNFLVFDLGGVEGTITRAILQLTDSIVLGTPRTYTVYDVSTPSATVRAGGQGLTAIYEDLGSGTSYGATTPLSEGPSSIHVNLNTAGVAALRAAQGGTFVVGGAYAAAVRNETISGSGDIPTAVQLILYVDRPGAPTYASDTFSRSVAQGWGNAEIGGVWNRAGTLADFAATQSSGQMALTTPNTTRSQTLWSVSAQDVDIKVRISTEAPLEGSTIAYIVARRTAQSTQYHGRLRFDPGGRCLVVAEQWVDGYNTILGGEREASCGLIRYENPLWLRMQVFGVNPTTIRLRAWRDGEPEPSTWQYTVQNSAKPLQAAGAIGLRAYMSKNVVYAPIYMRFDDFLATAVEP